MTLLAPFFPTRHGEAGNAVSELWLFHPRRWRRHFRASGFDIVRDEPMGLYYTGHLVLGDRRSLAQRRQMADRYGSACHLFVLGVSPHPQPVTATNALCRRTPPAGSPPPAAPGTDARHAARGGALQLLSAIGQGLMPVTQILIARLFGMATFGAYQANVAVVEVLTRAGTVGSVGGQHRFLAAHRAAGEEALAQRTLGTGIRLTAAVAGILAVALALVAPAAGPRLARAQRGGRAAHHGASRAAVRGDVGASRRDDGAKVARMNLYVRGIAEPLLLLLATVVAWRLGGGLRGLAVAHVSTSAVLAALAVAACVRVFGAAYLRTALRAERHPGFLRFSLPLGAADISNAILQRADTFIIVTFAGFDALAVYAAAEYFTRIIANPRYLFDHIVAPVMAEALHLKDRARVRYNLALVTRWVITASAPIAVTVIVLRAEILALYGGAFVAGTELWSFSPSPISSPPPWA